MGGSGAKWIIFDGDIDPMWIESLNTVMDDNKVLTLASNERIALTKQMRLLFEISNLRCVYLKYLYNYNNYIFLITEQLRQRLYPELESFT